MIKDPVCGMALSENTAKEKLVYQGRTHYFCSILCKQMFEREPDKYALSAKKDEKKSSTLS